MSYKLKSDVQKYIQIHRDAIKKRTHEWWQQRQVFFDLLKNKPCIDCQGWFEPCQMDFDHVRGNKLYDVSSMKGIKNRRLVMEEIQKCDLVCANCHRLRTYNRGQHDSKTNTLRDVKRHSLQTSKLADKTHMHGSASL